MCLALSWDKKFLTNLSQSLILDAGGEIAAAVMARVMSWFVCSGAVKKF
jgi:hypothetical protein